MKNLFLFGAGASTGCRGTNFKVPVGQDLFPMLKKQFPNTWGKLPEKLNAIFSENFEKGMEIIWNEHSTNIAVLMKDLAVLLCSANISNSGENLYLRIIQKTKDKKILEQSIFATLNYDCLIEIAANLATLKINYFGEPNKDSATIWKLHGSCNFTVKGLAANNGVAFSKGVVWQGTDINTIQPNQVREYCYGNNALYPAMSIYMKDKPLQIAQATIKGLQTSWQNKIAETNNIIVVGVRPNLEDKHIWDHISSSSANLFYCGAENEFKDWQHEKNRKDTYLGNRFENSIDKILDLI